MGEQGVGSRLRGNDMGREGLGETGRVAHRPQYPRTPATPTSSPLLGRGGYEIPAYAGMTIRGERNEGR